VAQQFLGDSGHPAIVVIPNDGRGSFGAPTTLGRYVPVGQAAAGDLDGDGIPDLAALTRNAPLLLLDGCGSADP